MPTQSGDAFVNFIDDKVPTNPPLIIINKNKPKDEQTPISNPTPINFLHKQTMYQQRVLKLNIFYHESKPNSR